ncbi:MAG: DnaB-like helicase C-terminal domain-containing protein, partial [Nanoarchaeota archaeon]
MIQVVANKKTIREIIEQIETQKVTLEYMSTGFPQVDVWLDGGFFKKELVVLGGISGLGKSYLAGTLTYNIARNGFKCGYFSLEISNEMIVSRLLGAIANIKPTHIRMGFLNPQQQIEKIKAKADLEILGDNIVFYDNLYTLKSIMDEI